MRSKQQLIKLEKVDLEFYDKDILTLNLLSNFAKYLASTNSAILFDNLKGKTFEILRLSKSKDQFAKSINIISFFPSKAFLIEILFVLSKFIGFLYCYNLFNIDKNTEISIVYLLVIFCLSWAIGLIVPTAPGGVGVFEACFLFFVGDNLPQNIILSTLIYFRLISTSADIFLSLPFLLGRTL